VAPDCTTARVSPTYTAYVIVSSEFWSPSQGGKRGRRGPSKEWLVEHVREGWDVGVWLGGSGEWSYEISRIDLLAEGLRVVVTERFTGDLDDYVALDEQRFDAQVVDDLSAPPAAAWRFGVEYADGLRITTIDQRIVVGGSEPLHPDIVIASLWSSGHIRDNPHPFWFEPSPPLGVLRFAVEWPLAGVPFLSGSIDLVELARRPTTPVEWPQQRIFFTLNGTDVDGGHFA
jgi:hypothetical protein